LFFCELRVELPVGVIAKIPRREERRGRPGSNGGTHEDETEEMLDTPHSELQQFTSSGSQSLAEAILHAGRSSAVSVEPEGD
jgi:hypothetical protein